MVLAPLELLLLIVNIPVLVPVATGTKTTE